jgi:hypothetical protein
MSRLTLIMISVFVLGYLGICAILFTFQRSLIYFPQPRSTASSTTILTLPSAAEQVLVSARLRDGPKALIYFGGNSEDVSANMSTFSAEFPDHAIYLMHYRGYGGSSGTPSEEALITDGLALFDEANSRHQEVLVIGRSLGSGIAVHVASLRPAARLVLVTPFDSLQEIAASQFPFFPVRWLIWDKYESWRYAPAVKAPTLIIAAENDEVIPRASSELLHSRFANGISSLKVLPATNHNSITSSPAYLSLLKGQ